MSTIVGFLWQGFQLAGPVAMPPPTARTTGSAPRAPRPSAPLALRPSTAATGAARRSPWPAGVHPCRALLPYVGLQLAGHASGGTSGRERCKTLTPNLPCSSNGALRRSGGSGLWRKVLGGAGLAPLAEQSEVDIEAGVPLMAPSSAGSGSLDAGSGSSRPPSQQAPRQQRQQQQQQPPQDQHRDAPEPTKTPMAAGPPSTLAPAVSGANLKLRGAVPGGAVLAVRLSLSNGFPALTRSPTLSWSIVACRGGFRDTLLHDASILAASRCRVPSYAIVHAGVCCCGPCGGAPPALRQPDVQPGAQQWRQVQRQRRPQHPADGERQPP